jgi:hypothetical protein
MIPDIELKLRQQFSDVGTLTDDKSGEVIKVSYAIQAYDRMAWLGDDEPRVKIGVEINGTIRAPSDKSWADRATGRRYTLVLADGKRRMHLLVKDKRGGFENADSRGIYQ